MATRLRASSDGRPGVTRSVWGRMSTKVNKKTGRRIASGYTQGFSMYSGGPVSMRGRLLSRGVRYRQVRAGLGLATG